MLNSTFSQNSCANAFLDPHTHKSEKRLELESSHLISPRLLASAFVYDIQGLHIIHPFAKAVILD
ncbi:hypothetical protein BLGI_1217 [Brevibacillus laterosporus GI-9]|nr:hypothetical protein BLGI_1217 [Brevibacillus laterosporus GI-9]